MLRRAIFVFGLGVLASGPAAAQDPSFRVVNNTGKTINEVYASPATANGWGHDRLGSEVISPGSSQIVRLPTDGQCRYDIRIVYQGGSAEERRNQDTCRMTDLVLGGAAPVRVAKGGNPSFNLVNRTGQVIEELYASPSATQEWGSDRLGTNTVAPGRSVPIRLPQGDCQYDIRIVIQGGTVREQRRVDACALTDYVVR